MPLMAAPVSCMVCLKLIVLLPLRTIVAPSGNTIPFSFSASMLRSESFNVSFAHVKPSPVGKESAFVKSRAPVTTATESVSTSAHPPIGNKHAIIIDVKIFFFMIIVF